MRELNECKAEVFRRSENRIKERRRKRSSIIAFSLVFCIAACFVLLIPAANNHADKDAAHENYGESDIYSCTEVVIRHAGYFDTDSRTITDAAETARILFAIRNLFDVSSSSVNGFPDYAEILNESLACPSTEMPTELNGFIIIFRTEDGYEMVYVLDGNELLDLNENTKITLTDLQTDELKEMLGISE